MQTKQTCSEQYLIKNNIGSVDSGYYGKGTVRYKVK